MFCYYEANKPVRLSVEAPMMSFGAVIMTDDRVVAYASRALTLAKQRYAQIEKEEFAVVFGCMKFHKLIYGKDDVTIESDHKPLESITRGHIYAATLRTQWMLLKLQPNTFKLVHGNGQSIRLAYCDSRLP